MAFLPPWSRWAPEVKKSFIAAKYALDPDFVGNAFLLRIAVVNWIELNWFQFAGVDAPGRVERPVNWAKRSDRARYVKKMMKDPRLEPSRGVPRAFF